MLSQGLVELPQDYYRQFREHLDLVSMIKKNDHELFTREDAQQAYENLAK
jgi:hypothetical protein